MIVKEDYYFFKNVVNPCE